MKLNKSESAAGEVHRLAPVLQTVVRSRFSRAAMLLIAGLLTSDLTHAANILVNPGFESDGGHDGNGITGWTCNSPGNVWINQDSYAHTGGNYYKAWGQWHNDYPNNTALWQDKSCLATAAFTADGWMFTLASDNTFGGNGGNMSWNEVTFRDASGNILALYRSEIFSQLLDPNFATDTWYDLPVTNICMPTAPYTVIGSTNLLVAPPGTVIVRYQINNFQANPPDGGSCYYDDETLNQVSGPLPPVISNVYPGNMLMASNHISFKVSSPSSTAISASGIHLVVNGADVSGSSAMTPLSASSYQVLYTGLVPNQWTYSASIAVTDSVGLSTSSTMTFDTISATNVWEAEDYDFTNGMYYDSPILSSTPQLDCYAQVTGALGVDYYSTSTGQAHYRTNDTTGTGLAGDSVRQKFITAQLTDPNVADYAVGYIALNDWFSYTRDIPAGQYNIYARLASGNGVPNTVQFDDMTSGSAVTLGTFNVQNAGWGTYNYYPLQDADGNLLSFSLSGKKTFRVTLTAGGDNMNFFMLLPAQPSQPVLSNISPTNTSMFVTNQAFTFSASSSAGISHSGVHLLVNGLDVSSSLVFTGPSAALNVSYPNLASNTIYTAVIAVTNTIGSGVARTVQFDTMSPTFWVCASDFDYNAGQYDTAGNGLTPGAYGAQNGSIINVDYSHTVGSSDPFPYRAGVPQQAATDIGILPAFAAAGATEYNLGYFNGGDWGNYTRAYPAGKYFIYGRLAGYAMNVSLDQVTSGLGTTSQTLSHLGNWICNPNGWQTYTWQPLTDAGGVAPVVVTLGGVETLRLTTGGNCNPLYFTLVPVSGISLKAAQGANGTAVSFPTVVGKTYQVFYRTSLSSGTWTVLSTVVGDGTTKSVSDNADGTRFYKVVGQ